MTDQYGGADVRPRPARGKLPLQSFTLRELEYLARKNVQSGFGRAREIHQQVFWEGRFAPNELQLSRRSIASWRNTFEFSLPLVMQVVGEDSERGRTSKAVLRTDDNLELEMVSIPMGRGRQTLCISSQVGCKMGCTFCETGRMGLLRQLTAAEIVSQVLIAKFELRWPIRNIVFMGMGEALDNADALIQALHVLNDPCGLAIGLSRITVCTVGHVVGLRRLANEGFRRLNLSFSLNATSDAARGAIMPINRKWRLATVQQELAAYRPRRNFTLGINYCLLPGINDSTADAAKIADFCKPIPRVLVNVIPYNPGLQPLTRAPRDTEVDEFIRRLRDFEVPVRRRVTKGRSVMAACGQLGNVQLRRGRSCQNATGGMDAD